MAGSSKTAHDDGGTPAGWPLIRFALRPSPADFTVVGFAARLGHHAVIYGGLSIAAIWACMFIFAPVETSLVSLGCVLVAAVIAFAFSSSSRAIVVTALLKTLEARKALEELLHRIG